MCFTTKLPERIGVALKGRVLWVLFLFCAAAVGFSQEEVFAGEIAAQQSRTLTLPEGVRHLWRVNASAGDIITADLTSDAFDTVLALRAPDGSVVAENDDFGDDLTRTDSRLENIRLAQAGIYTLEVRSFGGVRGGPYSLSLAQGAAVGTSAPPAGAGSGAPRPRAAATTPQGSIALNETQNATLTPASTHTWTFEGNAGDRVSITMTSNAFGSLVALLAPDGTVVAAGDALDDMLAQAALNPPPAFSGGITVRMDADGTQVETSGDLTEEAQIQALLTAPAVSAQLANLTLPQTGSYSIAVAAMSTEAGGAYTLTLEGDSATAARAVALSAQVATPGVTEPVSVTTVTEPVSVTTVTQPPAAPTVTPEVLAPLLEVSGRDLLFEEAQRATLRAYERQFWRFSGSEGEAVTLTLSSESFSPTMQLLSPRGAILTASASVEGTALIRNFVLPAAGNYTVQVTSARPTQSGEYSLQRLGVTPAVLTRPIEYGESNFSFLSPGEEHTWLFEGRVRDLITVLVTSDDFDALVSVRDAFGQELGQDDGGRDTSALLSRLLLPESARYSVTVRSADGTGGAYLLHLSLNERGSIFLPLEPVTAAAVLLMAPDSACLVLNTCPDMPLMPLRWPRPVVVQPSIFRLR